MGTHKQIKKHKWTHKAQTYAKYTKKYSSRSPFKVTQGQWNPHRSTGYQALPICDP